MHRPITLSDLRKIAAELNRNRVAPINEDGILLYPVSEEQIVDLKNLPPSNSRNKPPQT
jgi:hypothetical protein